jgi:hypothetical protein
LLFPSFKWVAFIAIWIVIAVPQMLFIQGTGTGAASSLRFQLGWVAAPDNWVWFWIKNLGWFIPLVVMALASRTLMDAAAKRFLWAFMPVFVLANLFIFQPWDWNNTKFLFYWFLAVCVLVAALLVGTWQRERSAAIRFLVVVVLLTMTLSGVLINLDQLLGRGRHMLSNHEELEFAGMVRDRTAPHALFVVGLQHNHPVPVLTGRRVLMTYPGWLWTWGIDYSERERDLRAIYAYETQAEELLKRYGVDYVVIGPGERQDFNANVSAYSARYPEVISTANYRVLAVASSAGGTAIMR